MSKRSIAVMCGSVLLGSIALAAGDIPTRYSGSFPTFGRVTAATGTFTGKALTLRYTRAGDDRPFRRTFAGGCAPTSPTQTRCTGRFQTPAGGGDQIKAEQGWVNLTWSGGSPAAMSFGM
jgi:hypothetical protein